MHIPISYPSTFCLLLVPLSAFDGPYQLTVIIIIFFLNYFCKYKIDSSVIIQCS